MIKIISKKHFDQKKILTSKKKKNPIMPEQNDSKFINVTTIYHQFIIEF